MAKYSAIKAAVNAYIKANGRKEITGSILNAVLNATIDSLGKYFQFAGVATPTTDPENPDQNVCYLAGEPGTYTNFDNIVLENEEIALLFFDGTWSKQRMLLGIQEVIATVDDTVGTPSVDVDYSEGQLELDFHNIKGQKGDTGAAAGFGTIGATIDGNIGTPGVSVQESGPATAKNLVFNFTNLKGETGVTSVVATIDNGVGTPTCEVSLVGQQLTLAFHNLKGEQGNTGSSVEYPFEIVNNLTTNDPTKALSAAQGVALEGEIGQLEAELYGINQTSELPYDGWKTQAFNYAWGSNADKIYFDTRVVIDSDHKIKKFTIDSEARSIGTMRVYFIKTSDNSIVTYKEVTLTGAVGFVTFDLELEAEYYASGPMYVGIWSEYVWTCLNGSGIGSATTRELVISTGVVSTNTSKIWGYGIEISEVADGDIDEINGALTALSGRIGDSEALVDEMSQDLYGSVSEAQRPTATWFDDYVFSSGWGSNTDKIYFDIRNVVDENHKIVKFKIYRLNSGTMRVYFLKQSDYSVVTYKEIQIGPNNGVNTYDLALEDSYYANGPMVVGIWSSFTWGHKNQSNAFPQSYDLVMSTGVVTQQPSRGWGYGIVVNVHNDGITDKVEKIMPGNDLAEILAKSDDDIVLGPYDYAVTTPIVLTSGMTIRGSFGKTRLILTDGCQTAITASNADGIKISDLEIVGTCPDYAYEMNGIIAGTGYDLVETEADAIALNYMGTEKGIYLYYCENVVLENVKINHITGSAIRVNHVGRDYIKGLNATNLFITNCYNGIFCENEHEFSQYTNWTITLCMIGLYIGSGNLIFSAGHATRCRVAVMFVAGTNHAHGIMNGIEIKHNQVAGLLCDSVDYGEFFEGLYLSYCKLIIRDCTGLYFDDIMTGNMHIDATGTGGINVISKLVKRNSVVVIDNQDTLTIGETIALY